MICLTCRSQISDNAMFCPTCGHQYRNPNSINTKDPVHVAGIVVMIFFAISIIAAIGMAS